MNSPVSRDVILDLLPAYLAGDVSSDSRALIENYMQQDPEFAALVKRESKSTLTPAAPPAMRRDVEMDALRKTKRLLRRRAWYVGLAIFFSLTTISYQYGPEGFKWTFADAPAASVLCALVALAFWGIYFRSRQRMKTIGV
ncbi:MAG TPA: hypothetical protein VGL38_06210 [bacterium]|jgi:anti-sigma factor RsiW